MYDRSHYGISVSVQLHTFSRRRSADRLVVIGARSQNVIPGSKRVGIKTAAGKRIIFQQMLQKSPIQPDNETDKFAGLLQRLQTGAPDRIDRTCFQQRHCFIVGVAVIVHDTLTQFLGSGHFYFMGF